MKNLVWRKIKGKVDLKRVDFIQNRIGKLLPHPYISLMKECDGGSPMKCDFEYFDSAYQENFGSGIGCFLTLNESQNSDFLETFLHPPEFFPEFLIAFAENGGGDYICFDYRDDIDLTDPPIVLWRNSADIGKDVSFIANNFEEFMGMLKESVDE